MGVCRLERLTSRNLKVFETLFLCDKIDGLACWHAASKTFDASFLEVRYDVCPVGDDSDRVGGRDECALAIDHISVTVTIARSTKLDAVLLHDLDERMGISQVGVRVSSTKVWQRDTILDRGFGKSELLDEDGARVWTGDTMETVEQDAERLCIVVQKVFDERKIKDLLEQDNIIRDGIDDLHLGGSVGSFAYF